MRRLALLLPLLLLAFSCGQKEVKTAPPAVKYDRAPSPLEQKISTRPSVERPLSLPVDPNLLDKCTQHLLFADRYITISDYESASEEIEQAGKYCSPDDPRYNYMKALILDIQEKKEEAFRYYYKAAKGYIEKGDMDSAFRSYSGMVSINPTAKETKEIGEYFKDEDY